MAAIPQMKTSRVNRAARGLLLAAAGIAIVGVATAPRLRGQSEQSTPLAFEVASVKPHPIPPGQFVVRIPSGRAVQARGDRFTDEAVTLTDLIMEAYEVKDYQISGQPGWAVPPEGHHFDIAAKTDGTPTASQLRQMLQTLLADRFKIELHREMRELPVYSLVIGKNGSKLREVREGEQEPTSATRPRETPKVLMSTIPMLVHLLSNVVDRPVVDQTGLAGTYEYTNLDWGQFGRDKRAGPLDPQSGESVFTAIQRDLGLKLEPRKDRVEVLVIDHADRPTAN